MTDFATEYNRLKRKWSLLHPELIEHFPSYEEWLEDLRVESNYEAAEAYLSAQPPEEN